MSEPAQEGVSRGEFDELRQMVSDLGQGFTGLADQVKEALAPKPDNGQPEAPKADLNALAKELGLDPKALRDATEKAKTEERKGWMRPLLEELLDEVLDEEPEGSEPKPEPGLKPQGGPEPDPDSEPTVDHWSDRPLSSLLGGKR